MRSKYSRKSNSSKKEGVKLAVYKETILLKSHGKTPTYVNITPQVREAIEKSGICTVISPHTTCSVFFEEFVHDYNEAGATSGILNAPSPAQRVQEMAEAIVKAKNEKF